MVKSLLKRAANLVMRIRRMYRQKVLSDLVGDARLLETIDHLVATKYALTLELARSQQKLVELTEKSARFAESAESLVAELRKRVEAGLDKRVETGLRFEVRCLRAELAEARGNHQRSGVSNAYAEGFAQAVREHVGKYAYSTAPKQRPSGRNYDEVED
jgi:ABC-type transporter Mla subunit MlaD